MSPLKRSRLPVSSRLSVGLHFSSHSMAFCRPLTCSRFPVASSSEYLSPHYSILVEDGRDRSIPVPTRSLSARVLFVHLVQNLKPSIEGFSFDPSISFLFLFFFVFV